MQSILFCAKNLRKDLTSSEYKLWYYLRAKRFLGLKFYRQKPIAHYIVDFVCFKPRVIIECDGGHHELEKVKDIKRDHFFIGQGFIILRFWNNEINENIEGVLERIYSACLAPLPDPLPQGERGSL